MPTLDDLAAQTVGEQEWRILQLEKENRRLREALRAQEVTFDCEDVLSEESPG